MAISAPTAAAEVATSRACRPNWSDRQLRWVLLLPAILLMAAVFLYPITQAAYLSLHRWTVATSANPRFAGLENFLRVFRDIDFYWAFIRTLAFAVVTITAEVVLGMALALILNGLPRGGALFSTLLLLPMMVTPVGVGLIWKFMLDYNFGIINYLLSVIWLPKQAVLAEPRQALAAMMLVNIWQWTSFVFIVLYAAIRALPPDPFEAAALDGASRWKTFWHVTLPLLRPVVMVVLIMRTAHAIRFFDQIFVLTGGGPGKATETLSVIIYRKAFAQFDFGYASALSLFVMLLTASLSYLVVRILYVETAWKR